MIIKNNKITVRQILVVVSGIILIYVGTPNVINALTAVIAQINNPISVSYVFWPTVFFLGLFSVAFIVSGAILLFKSKLIRILLQKTK